MIVNNTATTKPQRRSYLIIKDIPKRTPQIMSYMIVKDTQKTTTTKQNKKRTSCAT